MPAPLSAPPSRPRADAAAPRSTQAAVSSRPLPPSPAVKPCTARRPPGRFYRVFRRVCRGILFCTMRLRARGLERLAHPGGLLIAVSHVSHLDPVAVSTVAGRSVNWMAREEFYDNCLLIWFLNIMGAFPVNRHGRALPAVREALERLRAGEAVGIFPEGEIMNGPHSVVRGGRIRRGVAVLAARSGRPVLPVIVAGTEKLNRISPWLPAKRGKLWIMAGDFLHAPKDANTRQGRAAFAAELERAFAALYADMRREFNLPEDIVP